MKFTNDILKAIIKMGSNGKTIYDIALQLGMTYDELDDERKNNKKLDDALTRAALNEDQKLISDLKGLSLTEKFNSSQKGFICNFKWN